MATPSPSSLLELQQLKNCYLLFNSIRCIDVDENHLRDISNELDFNKIFNSMNQKEIKKHIINCIVALISLQKAMEKVQIEDNHRKNVLHVDNKVFIAAVTMVVNELCIGNNSNNVEKKENKKESKEEKEGEKKVGEKNEGEEKSEEKEKKEKDISLQDIIKLLPQKSIKGWNPLMWSVVVADRIKQEDIQLIYASDPMALKGTDLGYSPAHLLCMKNTPCLSLIRFLIIHNPNAFNQSCLFDNNFNLEHSRYPLHLSSEYSQSVELLQILLQLDVSVTKKKTSSHGMTPLAVLCTRKPFSAQVNMIHCLLDVDNTIEVIGNALSHCLKGHSINHKSTKTKGYNSTSSSNIARNTLVIVDVLLKSNPEAAKCENENENIMHDICEYTKGNLFKELISLLLSINKDILKKTDSKGALVIHYSSQYSTVSDVQYLLKLYPESALLIDSVGFSVLHYCMVDKENSTAVVGEKIGYLCREYPVLIHQVNWMYICM